MELHDGIQQGAQPSVLAIIDRDFRRRKMLVGFAKKLGRACEDASDVNELASRIDEWGGIFAAIVTCPAEDWMSIADELRRRNGDMCLYFVVDEKVSIDGARVRLPSGALLQRAPVSFPQFEAMLWNAELTYRRTLERHERMETWTLKLAQLQHELLSDPDAKIRSDLQRYFAVARSALLEVVPALGMAVVTKDAGGRWVTRFAQDTAEFSIGKVIRDAEDFDIFSRMKEPFCVSAGSFQSVSPDLKKLAGRHVLVLPQRTAAFQAEHLWLLIRPAQQAAFNAWEVGTARQFAAMAQLTIEGSLAVVRASERFEHFLHIQVHATYGENAEKILQSWARDTAGALGAKAYALQTSENKDPEVWPSKAAISRAELRELQGRVPFLDVGKIEIVPPLASDSKAHGMLMLLSEKKIPPRWIFVRLDGHIGRLDRAILGHARMCLTSTLKQRLETKSV